MTVRDIFTKPVIVSFRSFRNLDSALPEPGVIAVRLAVFHVSSIDQIGIIMKAFYKGIRFDRPGAILSLDHVDERFRTGQFQFDALRFGSIYPEITASFGVHAGVLRADDGGRGKFRGCNVFDRSALYCFLSGEQFHDTATGNSFHESECNKHPGRNLLSFGHVTYRLYWQR